MEVAENEDDHGARMGGLPEDGYKKGRGRIIVGRSLVQHIAIFDKACLPLQKILQSTVKGSIRSAKMSDSNEAVSDWWYTGLSTLYRRMYR